MPTFCRHNRFVERCPICSKTLPGHAEPKPSRRSTAARAPVGAGTARRRAARGEGLRVHREGRAQQDGYSSPLIPGVHASADAARLAREISFASARLNALETTPPGLYGEARALAGEDRERATWICFLAAYLSPLEGDDPFAGIRRALADSDEAPDAGLADLSEIPLGPRSSHDPARGAATLLAYRQWAAREGGQVPAFSRDQDWSPERRFERVFERLALPGFSRAGRYELLVTLGRLGIYELRPSSLHLAGARGLSAVDETTLAAKRVFGIGDPLLLERRAGALAEAVPVPIESLDLALANWGARQRATFAFAAEPDSGEALERASEALGL